MRTLYPEIEPYTSGHLEVGDGQRIYYEVSGNPDGKPAVCLHGGPGGASSPKYRRAFDPEAYRIVLFDQRGCGLSTPHVSDDADLSVNTTQKLIADTEALRAHLGIDRWLAFGGSWGSTLALAYAEEHPQRVTELVLRGIFLLRRSEIDWYYHGGAANLFPERWDDFLAPVPAEEREGDLIEAYHRLLHNRGTAERAALAWSTWEGSTSELLPHPEHAARNAEPRFALAFARIENHYFRHGGFLKEGQLLHRAERLHGISGVIVQGRYDVVCPATSAWALHQAWPQSQLQFVDDAGHSFHEPGITSALIGATDGYRQ